MERLARDLAQVGVPLLQYEGTALDEALAPFIEYHELHSELYHECYTGLRDQHAAEALLLAFEQQRFDEVVQHIESLSPPLSGVEQKILAYAQAQ